MSLCKKSTYSKAPLTAKVYVLCHIFLCLLCTHCTARSKDSFVYQYQLSQTAVFDLRKSYSASLGTVLVINNENRKKKFRHYNNSPWGYFYNKKTKKTKHLHLVTHNPAPRKADSIFWALLNAATWHHPMKPLGRHRLSAYLNFNLHNKPREIMEYVIKNSRDMEYHIFDPEKEEGGTPDFIIKHIQVIR